MKIIFDTKEQMDFFLNPEVGCTDTILDIPKEECDSYYKNGNCKKCILDHIEVTYVKNCTECAKTSSCRGYYRGDVFNKLIKCEPRAK